MWSYRRCATFSTGMPKLPCAKGDIETVSSSKLRYRTEILLSVTDDEDLKDISPLIWDQLDMYITQTKRF